MRLASMLLALAVLRAGGTGPGAQDEAARPVVMLVDVYDTTFLVGSKHRCDPACEGGASGGAGDDAECAKDLNNDDVTRFGLGQRREFGIVRDAGCPFPHLTAGPEQRIGANRVAAVVHTDFSLDVVFGAAGSRLLDASDVAGAGEALDYSGAVRAAWIVEPRHMFPQTYEQAVRLRAGYDVIFTHVRELVARYPGMDVAPASAHARKHARADTLAQPAHTHRHRHATQPAHHAHPPAHTHMHTPNADNFRFCPFGTTYLRRWEHRIYPKSKLLSLIASRKGGDANGGGMQGHRMRHEAIRRLGYRSVYSELCVCVCVCLCVCVCVCVCVCAMRMPAHVRERTRARAAVHRQHLSMHTRPHCGTCSHVSVMLPLLKLEKINKK